MNYGLYVLLALFLVVVKTTLMPMVPLFDHFYDPLVPLVVYLGLFRPFREGLPMVILLGFVQDSMTGGAFGLYLSCYFWIFLGVVWVITFLQVTNTLLILFVVAAGVLVQNLIFFGTVGMAGIHGHMPAGALRTMAVQMGWALVTGPVFLTLLDRVQGVLKRWQAERAEKEA